MKESARGRGHGIMVLRAGCAVRVRVSRPARGALIIGELVCIGEPRARAQLARPNLCMRLLLGKRPAGGPKAHEKPPRYLMEIIISNWLWLLHNIERDAVSAIYRYSILTFGAKVALPAGLADAGAPDALAVLIAVRYLAVAERDVALGALPAVLAVAHAAPVLAVARAQHRAHRFAAVRAL